MVKVRTNLHADIEIRNLLTKQNGTFSVFRDLAPEGESLPLVVWSIVSSDAMNDIDCPATEDKFTMRFDVYSLSQEECDSITRKLRMAVNSFARTQGFGDAPESYGEYRNSFIATTIEEW